MRLLPLTLLLTGCPHRSPSPPPAVAAAPVPPPPPAAFVPAPDQAAAYVTVTQSSGAPVLRATWDDPHATPRLVLAAHRIRTLRATYDARGARLTAATDVGDLLLLDRPGGTVVKEAQWLGQALGVPVAVDGTEVGLPPWTPPPPAERTGPAGCGAPGDTVTMGSLQKQAIDDVVRGGMAEVQACYRGALGATPTLEGYVATRFVIAPTGAVTEVVAVGDTLGQPSVATCVTDVLATLRFPEPAGCGVVVVTYPFVFAPR